MTRSQSFLNFLPTESQGFSSLCVALLGGGGKTSLLLQLGKEFAQENSHVLMTSITKAGPSNNFPITLTGSNGEISLSHLFKSQNPVYLLQKQIRNDKYWGIPLSQLESLRGKADITIFECDGARNLSLKAHSHWDPVVPDFASHVIIVIGADVINTKLKDGKVHRPEIFKSLWGINDNTHIDVQLVTKVLTDKRGYISKIPSNGKIIYFINKADTFYEEAKSLAIFLTSVTSDPVFFGSVRDVWWEKAC